MCRYIRTVQFDFQDNDEDYDSATSDCYEPTLHGNAETYSSDDDVEVEEGREEGRRFKLSLAVVDRK